MGNCVYERRVRYNRNPIIQNLNYGTEKVKYIYYYKKKI